MRIEMLTNNEWHYVKKGVYVYDIIEKKFWRFSWTKKKTNEPESWKATIAETWRLQEETGIKHRAMTTNCGLRAIWCNGSNYWCV